MADLHEEQDAEKLPAEFHSIVSKELEAAINNLPPAQAEIVRMVCMQGLLTKMLPMH